MIFRFDDFDLDVASREIRRGGALRPLQPRAFDLLVYLVKHRDRVVPKDELLDQLWPGVVVSEGSLQRAVSLARAAIDDDGNRIRTVQRRGYRFIAPVQEAPGSGDSSGLRPRFALSGDVHVAYHLVGEGELDIVIVTGWVFPMRAFFDHPAVEGWIRGLARFGRVVLFDKRGTGLSDRVKALPTLEQRADDLRAVLDEAGSRAALLIGLSEGGPLAILYAATFPQRVRGLLLAGSFARWGRAEDYPHGWPAEAFEALRNYIATAWGRGDTIRAVVGSRAGDPQVGAWAARAEQEGASPGAALDLLAMNLQVDVRPLLRAVRVPTVVLHGTQDPVIPLGNAHYLAAHIPGARLIEVATGDHVFMFEGAKAEREALRWLVEQPGGVSDYFLATVLAVSAVPESGLADAQEVVLRHHGVRVSEAPAWVFDGPQRAIRCAHALLATRAAGQAGLGIHAGEIQRSRGILRGEAIEAARDIAAAALPGEVRVSRVVRDLVHGSAYAFELRPAVRVADGRQIATLATVVK